MKISDPLGKVYTHTMFKKRSYDMRGGNGNGGEIPEGKYIYEYDYEYYEKWNICMIISDV